MIASCHSRAVVLCVLTAAAGALSLPAASTLAAANADLQAGKADEARTLLNEALKTDPAEANNLLCRVEYSLQQFSEAAGHCEQAVNLSPNNARYHLWLGRATGERASRASFITAFPLAKKTRSEFEVAVKLDPRDAEALSDLGEFYKEAPGAVGGGTDKAEDIARKLDAVAPTRAHNLRGEIAEKQKDLPTAEKELKAALSGNRAAIQWIQLASFYRRHQRWSEMLSAIDSGVAAVAHEKEAAVALVNGASILVRANQRPEQAIKLYESYLASPDKTEEAPAFDVLTRLASLRMKMGDSAGAEKDRAAALALAHDYKPALEVTSPNKGK